MPDRENGTIGAQPTAHCRFPGGICVKPCVPSSAIVVRGGIRYGFRVRYHNLHVEATRKGNHTCAGVSPLTRSGMRHGMSHDLTSGRDLQN